MRKTPGPGYSKTWQRSTLPVSYELTAVGLASGIEARLDFGVELGQLDYLVTTFGIRSLNLPKGDPCQRQPRPRSSSCLHA